jgi:hypothetical protein
MEYTVLRRRCQFDAIIGCKDADHSVGLIRVGRARGRCDWRGRGCRRLVKKIFEGARSLEASKNDFHGRPMSRFSPQLTKLRGHWVSPPWVDVLLVACT